MKTSALSDVSLSGILNSLEQDGVVVMPTRLGYAILSMTTKGTNKLYELKNRPLAKPSGVLANVEIYNSLTGSSNGALIKRVQYPVGIIKTITKGEEQILSFSLKNDTVAFFFNLDPLLNALAKKAWDRQRLIVVSSANKAGFGNTYSEEKLHVDFKEKADVFVENSASIIPFERMSFENVTTTLIDIENKSIVRKGVFADRIIAKLWNQGIVLTQNYNQNYKSRGFSSCLFLLAHKRIAYKKIKQNHHVDWFVLDLEDGCPASQKSLGRDLINEYGETDLFKQTNVAVRLNGLENMPQLLADLKTDFSSHIKGFALPMLNGAEDVLKYDKLILELEDWLGLKAGHFKFFPIIETAEALKNAAEIAGSSKRNIAMFLGHADLFADLGTKRTAEFLNKIRLDYLIAARSSKLAAFDTPFENVWDVEGLRKDSLMAKEIGLDGKVALNSKQIDVINKTFKPLREVQNSIRKKLKSYHEGCEIIEGEFIAPPIINRYKKVLLKESYESQSLGVKGVRGRTFSYGLDYKNVSPGEIVKAPYDTTIDDSWITAWQALVQTGNPLETSKEFCHKLGFESRVVPFHAVLSVGLCLAVECFSESSVFHLGVSNVKYLRPAYVGDTISSVMILDRIKSSSNGKYSIFYTRLVIVNHKDEVLMAMNRNSLFPYIHPENIPNAIDSSSHPNFQLFQEDSNLFRNIALNRSKIAQVTADHERIEKGELILHSIAKPIGLSNSLAFSTLCKNTHPLHINSARYGLDGLVVCGGFIIPMVHASAARDIKNVLDQEVVDTMHINKIHHEDCVGAMTYVVDYHAEDGFECITLRTFGLKNIDAERDLLDVSIPVDLLASKDIKPSDIELVCDAYCPVLSQRICSRMTWKIWRRVSDKES